MKVSDIQLSDSTKKLINNINHTIRLKYEDFFYRKSENKFIEQYKIISDDSWPNCLSYNDFTNLPAHIKAECETVHKFSPEIYLKDIQNDSKNCYQQKEYATTNDHTGSFLLRHKSIFQDKHIVDFACKYGEYSFFALLNGASSVLAIDVRENNIKVAKSIKEDLSISDTAIDFVVSDIHDYQKNKTLCNNCNTVFLLGIMYHIHDHVDVVNSIFDNNVENIVIESGIFDHEKPIIWWKEEPTFEPLSGWHNCKNTIIVGYPTVSWFDLLAKHHGYYKVDQQLYTSSASINYSDKFARPRAILLYQKKLK